MRSQMRQALETFEERINNLSIRHILLNYSETEIGSRHPSLPIGVAYRDQGQFDLYAGQSRLIGTMQGQILLLSNSIGLTAKGGIYLNTPSIQQIKLANKNLSVALYKGQPLAALKQPLDNVWVIGPETRADPNTGELINKVPISDIMEPRTLFDVEPTDPTHPAAQKYAIMAQAMGLTTSVIGA